MLLFAMVTEVLLNDGNAEIERNNWRPLMHHDQVRLYVLSVTTSTNVLMTVAIAGFIRLKA